MIGSTAPARKAAHARALGTALFLTLVVGTAAEAQTIKIRNRTVEKPADLWVAIYQCGANNCERAKGPWKIEIGESKTVDKPAAKVGFVRKVRWSKDKDDLKKSMSTGAWKKVGGDEDFGPAGSGYKTCNISDRGHKGRYKSKTDAGLWIAEGWENTWDKVWGPLSSAGDNCTVVNNTRRTYWISEYQRKTQYAGQARRLQGGSGSKWKLEPGESLTFKKDKLTPGYTWRWVRWQKKENAPYKVEGKDFGDHSGWKSNYKGVGRIYIDYKRDGSIRGYNHLEYVTKRELLHEGVHALIQSIFAKPDRRLSLPDWLLKELGIDALIADAQSRLTESFGNLDPVALVENQLAPIVNGALPASEVVAVANRVVKLNNNLPEVRALLAPGSAKPKDAKSIRNRLKGLGILVSPGQQVGNKTTLAAGITAGGQLEFEYRGFNVAFVVNLTFLTDSDSDDLSLGYGVTLSRDFNLDVSGAFGGGVGGMVGIPLIWEVGNEPETVTLGIAGGQSIDFARQMGARGGGIDMILPPPRSKNWQPTRIRGIMPYLAVDYIKRAQEPEFAGRDWTAGMTFPVIGISGSTSLWSEKK